MYSDSLEITFLHAMHRCHMWTIEIIMWFGNRMSGTTSLFGGENVRIAC